MAGVEYITILLLLSVTICNILSYVALLWALGGNNIKYYEVAGVHHVNYDEIIHNM